MYAVETTDKSGSFYELTGDPSIWHARGIFKCHKEAGREALNLRDADRKVRPVVRVRGTEGDDRGRTIYISQRLRYPNEK